MTTRFTTENFADFETSIRGFIAEVANAGLAQDSDDRIKVIPGNSNYQPPAGLYGSLLLMTDIGDGWPSVRSGENDDAQRVDRTATYSLQFYRDGAMAAMMKFTGLMHADLWVDRAAARGFRIDWNGNVRRIDSFIESFSEQFEERAAVDLTVRYMQYSRVDSGRVDIVPLIANGESQNVGE